MALFHLQSLYLFFLFKLYMSVQWPLSNNFTSVSDKNEMLTLQMVEIRLGWGPTFLVNKLETEKSSDLETLRHFLLASVTSTASNHQKKLTEFDIFINPSTKMT